jgi:threonine dehydratase
MDFVQKPKTSLMPTEQLDGIAVRTPLLRSDELDARTGGKVFVKCENLQRSGAFEFRGAYNCLSGLNRNVYPGGVVAHSAPLSRIATMEACERSSHSDKSRIRPARTR